ncbi:MAG TPA: hypothetical protein VHA09_02190, partial [Nitrososphaera sp.]|nr:hypothetical protein [Nitrososphaera sp.]
MATTSQFASAQTTGNGTSTPTGNATSAGGNATAAATGNATMATGNATAAIGGNSTASGNATATTPFYEKNATLVLTPSSVKAGDQFTVTGSGYNNNQEATMMIDNDTLVATATIKTDDKGGFTATVILPADITGGSHKVSATDATGVKATTTLDVTPSATTPSGNATATTPSGNATATTPSG